MHYYQHNIGDFNNATRHLSRIERSIYRDLIEMYYDTEKQLPCDLKFLCRKIIADFNECSTTVEDVLNEFFIKTSSGWYHDRCEHEIGLFKGNKSQKSIAGKASAAKREEKRQQALSERSTTVEIPLNDTPTKHKTVNIKHKTVNNIKEKRQPASPINFYGAEDSVVADFVKQRKTKITQTAIDGIMRESGKAGIGITKALQIACERGWQSFKSDWMKDSNHQKNNGGHDLDASLRALQDYANENGIPL